MKPILMLGAAAYSPFRLDAIRTALGACAASLSKADVDARWVYAIQSEDGVTPSAETLGRAALLLNAENRVPDAAAPKGYRLVGDADFDSCAAVASAITPVPGGVGPMTITMLLWNTLEAARKSRS